MLSNAIAARLPANCTGPTGRWAWGLFVLATLLAAPVAGHAQCRASDDDSAGMIAHLRSLVSSTDILDGYSRRDLKIPVVDTATIVLVTHAPTCNKALTAYKTTLPSDFPTPLPADVYVVKVGDVYVAMYPTGPTLGASRYVVLDSRFKVLSTYSF